MAQNTQTQACPAGYFQFTFNIDADLPGTAGQPVYASASVNAVGTGTTPPAGYLTWDNYSSGTTQYLATISNPADLPVTSTTLNGVVGIVSTQLSSSNPAIISTTITQSIPAVLTTTVSAASSSNTNSFTVSDVTGIQNGMAVSGGMSSGGSAFAGGTTVSLVSGSVVTVSNTSLVPLNVQASIQFASSPSLSSIQVASTSGIETGMTPTGGMTNAAGNGFQGNTTVSSVSGNTVNLSLPTVANVIAAGAGVSFTNAFSSGTTTIVVQNAANIVNGMIPIGGMPAGGNAFSATTTVTNVDLTTNTITLSEATVNATSAGQTVQFAPGLINQIIVSSATGITAGMSVSGGSASATGDAFSPNAYVLDVNQSTNTITISDNTPFTNLFVGGTLNFTPPVPSQQIGTIGTSSSMVLCIPSGQVLSGARIIFTLGNPGNFPFNSAGQPIVPVPYKGNVVNVCYDFIEFAWTSLPGGGNNLNYDTSIVDQFGFPISIEFGSSPKFKRGLGIDRSSVITNYGTQVPAAIAAGMASTAANPSPTQVTAFFGALSTVMSPYRILAPADAFLLAQEQSASQSFQQAVSPMNTYFDALIKAFFDAYDSSLPNTTTFVMQNVAGYAKTGKAGSGAHDLSGIVTTLTQTGTDNQQHTYRVLQLTDVTPTITAGNGSGWVYTIYEPFFSSNGYPTKPPPPYWLTSGVSNNVPVPVQDSPTLMVFGASGAFADSDISGGTGAQPTPSGADMVYYQTLLGAIENQIVTAISRGIVLAPQWRWLYQAPNNTGPLSPQVTVNTDNTLTIPQSAYVPVYTGMEITQAGGTQAIGAGTAGNPNIVTDVSMDNNGNTTVSLSMANLVSTATSDVNVVFTYHNIANPFYQLSDPMSQAPFNGLAFNNNGIWNYFAQFFHQAYDETAGTGVSIGGLAYAYAFDDQGNFSTDISKDNPDNAIVNIGA